MSTEHEVILALLFVGMFSAALAVPDRVESEDVPTSLAIAGFILEALFFVLLGRWTA